MFESGSQDEKRQSVADVFGTIATTGSTITLVLTPLMTQIAERQETQEGWDLLVLAVSLNPMRKQLGISRLRLAGFEVPTSGWF